MAKRARWYQRIEMASVKESELPEVRLLYAILLCALKDWQTKGRSGIGYKGESEHQINQRRSRHMRQLEQYFFKPGDIDEYGSLNHIANHIYPQDPNALIQAIQKMLIEQRQVPDFRYMPHGYKDKNQKNRLISIQRHVYSR